MFVVYSDNQAQKKHLQQQFLYQSNFFAVPINNVKSLHDLIDKTVYQFYQKHQSIFIEKLKIFISGIVDMNFSFTMFREILSIIKKKDVMADLYRNQLISMNRFFLQEDEKQNLFLNTDSNLPKQNYQDQFEKALISHKTLELIDIDTEPLISLGSFGQYQQFLKQKINSPNSDQKLSIFESQPTNDETLEEYYQSSRLERNKSKQLHEKFIQSFKTPSKQSISLWNDPTSINKRLQLITSKKSLESSIQNFIDSFKKQRSSAVVQMFLNDESISKLAKNQNKKQLQRKRLQQQLLQQTRTVKSNQYNRKIKTILMNKKLRQRKKPKHPLQTHKSKISPNVINAYELRRVSSQIIHIPQIYDSDIKFFKSANQRK